MTEYGEVVITRSYQPDAMRDTIRIDRADPRARIAAELLDNIAQGLSEPWATLTGNPRHVLTLTDDYGQKFVYRIYPMTYDPQTASYTMEWPD